MAVERGFLRVRGFSYVSVIPPSVSAQLGVNTDITKRGGPSVGTFTQSCALNCRLLGYYAAALEPKKAQFSATSWRKPEITQGSAFCRISRDHWIAKYFRSFVFVRSKNCEK